MITKGKVSIFLGIVCFAIAISIIIYNRNEDNAAGVSAASLLEGVDAQITNSPVESDPTGDMKSVDVNGQSFIGIITIPAIDIRLPIQQEWSSENAKTSPCRYKGSVYSNDLIVAGHNYQRHFGKLNQLLSGDTVIVTDIDGRQYYYEVTYTETIGTYDVDAMDKGDWDFTVFTCTKGGASRVTVRCEFVKVVTPGSGESVVNEIENKVTAD
ncbi:sortase [Butyrivibrio sp. NC2002]|jgi:sortase A|uniref:sortase n=1 Tax=Butyrivibrio sp. NC2002 TaxID=1410610 RepID=UPI00068BF57F|nr:sortase [Butyrivibrio sp. NC2002]